MNVMRFFAPGAEKVRQFSIRLMLTRRGAFRIDWGSFRTSPEVARQLKAAGELGSHCDKTGYGPSI